MNTEEIHNYRRANDHTITGGQPTEEQLRAAAAEGIQEVINLATREGSNSLPNEKDLVQSLGMQYHHIPVEWEDPKKSDFEAFETLLRQIDGRRVLIHCAANFRVTAFYALYAMRNLGWSETQAEDFRKSVWEGSHDPVWEAFYAEIKPKTSSAR